MAHKTLDFSITWRPKPSLPVEGRALLHFPRPGVVLPPTLVAVGCRAGTRIVAAGRGECDGSGNVGVVREGNGVQKNVDIATLGNLCVDVVLDVPSLPPASTAEHRAYMERLAASPPDKVAFQPILLIWWYQVESVTGIKNPIQAGQELISRGVRTKWVIIKLGSKGSILVNRSTVSCAPSFKVNVVDTVGCGDSFAAAIAFGFLHRMPAVNTLALANAVGAATATGCGAGRNVAHLNKVLQLLKQSNVDEDGIFWDKLIEDSSSTNEVVLLLSKVPINGHKDRFVRIRIRDVVVELLTKFEKTSARSMVQS
ncbi:hypothetical protein BHE74_00001855 [Ensete ventricosum]|nr:hypothetical protein BHE74_00001855 [Ensete ventricosum]